jgi:UDP-glucose 4-epimerase
MRILITGAGGYIGSHLVERLKSNNHQLLLLAGKSMHSEFRLKALNVRGLKIDTTERQLIGDVFNRFQPEAVVHLAALKSPEESMKQPDLYLGNNLKSLQNVFESAVNVGSKIFIHASSSSVYGDTDSLSINESSATIPISAYGLSKLNCEEYLGCASVENMVISSLRFFNVIGSTRSDLKERATFHLVPATISRIREKRPPLIMGHNLPTQDGTAIRDYIHVSDAVRFIEQCLESFSESSLQQQGHLVFNVGSGIGTSVLTIVDLIQEYLGTRFAPEFLPARSGDPVSIVSNINLARTFFGFKPIFSLEEMIKTSI